MKTYGFEKSVIKRLEEFETGEEKVIDPIKSIIRLIKNANIDSVTLRHRITKLWIKKGFEWN